MGFVVYFICYMLKAVLLNVRLIWHGNNNFLFSVLYYVYNYSYKEGNRRVRI
jgi:hypothetical protein